MASSSLEVVDPLINLAHTVNEFEETLQHFPFVDVEERQHVLLAYEDTSKNSLESFLQSLSRPIGLKHEGVLRLASLFHLIRPGNSQPKASKSNGVPSALFGVLKVTLIAGHSICDDLMPVIAKFDQLSQCTSRIHVNEFDLAAEVVQSLLVQLASFVVQTCTKILRLSEFL